MRKRRQVLPKEPVTTYIEKFSHDGRGIARVDGKVTFIAGALAEETVTFEYTRRKSDFDEGRLLTVIDPSPQRVEPLCPHYSMCGGCSLQHLDSESQIYEKQTLLLDVLARIAHSKPENILPPLTAKSWNYRNKARLSVRYVEKKKSTLVGFREKNNPRYITDIHTCPIMNEQVDSKIDIIRQLLDELDDPKSIAQIEVAAGDYDVSLIIRHLNPLSCSDESKIKSFSDNTNFRIFLQSSGPDSVFLFHPKNIDEFLSYNLPEFGIEFKFHPTDFTQVNAAINRLMVPLAVKLLDIKADDVVLDLFCGLGNFSLPLAQKSARVIGVEGSDTMVLRASMNASANKIDNVVFLCANLDADEVLKNEIYRGANKLLIDPPRTGALAIVQQIDTISPERIVYVSCNPVTLARDADILIHQHGYRLISAGVMDMFPNTSHVESIAVFELVNRVGNL